MDDYKKKNGKDRLLLDQYQQQIRYIMEDRELKEAWDWESTLGKFRFCPPEKMGIPETALEEVYARAEQLLRLKPETQKLSAGTMLRIRKLGKQPAKQGSPEGRGLMAMAADRMGHILSAHPESDIYLRAECLEEADGELRTSFLVGSGTLSKDALAAMIRGAYGNIEYETVERDAEEYPIQCYATAQIIVKDKREFERQDKEQAVESWASTLLTSLACSKNYAAEFRFHPLIEDEEKEWLNQLAADVERTYRELAFYSEVGWNNGITGGGNLSMKLSALHNLIQNFHFLRNARQDGIQAGETYSFSYGKSSKTVNQHAIRLMAELEYQLIKLRHIQNSVGWAVTIFAAAADEDTADAITAIISGAAEQVNISLKWLQKPCCAMIASNRDILPLLTFPSNEFAGFEFIENEEFSLISPTAKGVGLDIGNILWNGTQVSRFYLPPQALNRHAFICGMTGAGKTNTLFKIIEEIAVPFLVIEPVKGEYRSLLTKYEDTRIWTMRTSDAATEGVQVLQINPFWFPMGANLSFHIDSVKTIISSAFELSAAMPNIVEQCLYNVYMKSGWNIVTNINIYQDILPEEYLYPTFSDFTNEVKIYLDKSEFGEEVLGNYKGALLSRLRSFTNGAKGALLNTAKYPDYKAFMEGRNIIELEGLADDGDKCLVMGTILVQYYQYLKGHFHDLDKQNNLKHIIVIEEAHRLFKNVKPQSKGAEGADPTGQLVESLSNIMAEIRAFGEGMLIVDQSPTKIAEDVVKNSGTKIIHRIDHGDDIKMLQAAMLMPGNTVGFSSLAQGEALVRSDAMLRPCKVKVARSEIKENYSLSESFKAGELKDYAINDTFVANTILQDEEISAAIQDELNRLFRSLVWMEWSDWYDVVAAFLRELIYILKGHHVYDRVEERFNVMREIISTTVKKMFSPDGTQNTGLMHMYVMRLLAFYADRRDGHRVKAAAIEMMRIFFRERLCGSVIFSDAKKVKGEGNYFDFTEAVDMENDLERSYMLYCYISTVRGEAPTVERFLEHKTLLSGEKYRELYAELEEKLHQQLVHMGLLA